MNLERECGSDAAAYVLGALDDGELVVFRQHLSSCPACREEVELLESAVDALPLMVPQVNPPATLRANVMAEVRRDGRQRSPSQARPSRSRRWLLAPVPKAALAGVGALLVAAVITLVLTNESASTQLIRARTAWRAGGAVVKVSGNHGELLVEGMPAPPAGKVYEVWLERGRGKPAPTTALFDVDSSGQAGVTVPGDLKGVSKLLVTAEPAGGSQVPTSSPVVIADLS